jgi:glycosyltransferase involved in cell wall biosynthesis
MKTAYVTTYDPRDVTKWSGIGRYAADALEEAGLEIAYIGPLKFQEPFGVKVRRLAHTELLSQSYDPERHPAVAKNYAKQVDQQLKQSQAECVLSLSTIPIAYCQATQPIAFWTDATFAGLTGLYPGYRNQSRETIRNGNSLEQAALDRCSLAIYASEWAAQTAVANYAVDPRKLHVVPFGPNCAEGKDVAEIEEFIQRRPASPCRLLFLGAEWERKGGPLALEVARNLGQRGLPTELHIAGCDPPLDSASPYVVRHGFINKGDPMGAAKIDALLSAAHFLLVPSRAECFGLVFIEASSFGVPSLAAEVGGVPTAVRSGRNGQLFSLAAPASEYADYIMDMMADAEAYRRFARSSYAEYSENLTWTCAATKVRNLLASMTL